MTDVRHLGGFERDRGEEIRTGQHVLAVPPGIPANTPVRPAPPYPRQVQSVFDSRPIGGVDFVSSVPIPLYAGIIDWLVTAPLGYVSIIKRIELEATPALFMSGVNFEFRFLIDGIVQPSWEWVFGSTMNERVIDPVFFVVPPNIQYGVRSLNDFSLFTVHTIIARFIGTLVLDANLPVTEQVASLPTKVTVVEKDESHV